MAVVVGVESQTSAVRNVARRLLEIRLIGDLQVVQSGAAAILPIPIPKRRCDIQFLFPELLAPVRYWFLLVEPGKNVYLCSVDRGFNVDPYVTTDLKSRRRFGEEC